MKLLWRLLVASFVKQPIYKRLPWTDEDSQSLYLFLQGGCGKRFVLKLREAAADASFRSVYGKSSDAVSAAGYARGFCDCLGLVFRLAQSLPSEASEYVPAESQTLPGVTSQKQAGQDWQGWIGGGGMIAP
jgi:hypothetical protein